MKPNTQLRGNIDVMTFVYLQPNTQLRGNIHVMTFVYLQPNCQPIANRDPFFVSCWRTFRYNTLAFDRYNQTVVSLAVLPDERADWRPDWFEYGDWGATTGIRSGLAAQTIQECRDRIQ